MPEPTEKRGEKKIMKSFVKPRYEIISFSNNVIAASGCGCYDAEWCPSDYRNCTNDGAGCECEINHNPAIGNCTPCKSYNA